MQLHTRLGKLPERHKESMKLLGGILSQEALDFLCIKGTKRVEKEASFHISLRLVPSLMSVNPKF